MTRLTIGRAGASGGDDDAAAVDGTGDFAGRAAADFGRAVLLGEPAVAPDGNALDAGDLALTVGIAAFPKGFIVVVATSAIGSPATAAARLNSQIMVNA